MVNLSAVDVLRVLRAHFRMKAQMVEAEANMLQASINGGFNHALNPLSDLEKTHMSVVYERKMAEADVYDKSAAFVLDWIRRLDRPAEVPAEKEGEGQ